MKWWIVVALLATRLLLMAEEVVSPNGQTRVSFYVEEGRMTYEMSYKGQLVVAPSHLGIELINWPSLMEGFEMEGVEYASFDETWQPVWGEETSIRNHYNEMAAHVSQPTI